MHSCLDVSMVAEHEGGDSALMVMSSRTRERVLAARTVTELAASSTVLVRTRRALESARWLGSREREADYLEFLAKAERKAVDPDQYLDVHDENESGWDAEEKELLEEAMQFWSRLKRTWRTMMEGERD